MKRHLKNHLHVPPEPGFEYVQPETGCKRNGQSLEGTVRLVIEHRQQNNLPRQSEEEVRDDVEEQMCVRLGSEWCNDAQRLGFRTDWDTLREGTKSLASWALTALSGGNPYVDQAEADRRAEICSKCFANVRGGGCLSCGFGDMVRALLKEAPGPIGTPKDDLLQTCGVCGCALQKKVWLKTEVVNRWASDQQKAAYAEIPHCWMNEEG